MTICTHNRECLFGEVANHQMQLNELGWMVEEEWRRTDVVRKNVVVDECVVMPNHVHGILIIVDHGVGRGLPAANPYDSSPENPSEIGPSLNREFGKPIAGALSTMIGQIKSAVTKQINESRNTPGFPVWQRNYYERVIRNEQKLYLARQYIIDNPAKWEEDENNPKNLLGHTDGVT